MKKSKTKPRYLVNLRKEMTQRGIEVRDIAQSLFMAESCVYQRIRGDANFTADDAIKVKRKFFPDLSVDYLFERKEHTYAYNKRSDPDNQA